MSSPRTRWLRPSLGVAVATGTVFALAAPAAAHITVDPSETPGGGYATVNVKVPNERDDASTVEVELHLDREHPLPSVQPEPVPGWDIEIESEELDEPLEVHGSEVTEAPSRIIWSGGEIEPGMFQQFPVSVGSLPEGGEQLVLPALQTYDNGEVVRWIDDPTDEAEHPAAVLDVTDGDDGHGADGAGDDATEDGTDDTDDAEEPSTEESAASDTTARVLGGVGIGVGALGVAFGLLARRRTTGSA